MVFWESSAVYPQNTRWEPEVKENKPAWRFDLITINILVTAAAVTMRRKKKWIKAKPTKRLQITPFNSTLPLHHHPWHCSMVQTELDQRRYHPSEFWFAKLFFSRPPPAPVTAGFGSQGSRRATYHNPYLVSSMKNHNIFILWISNIMDIHTISNPYDRYPNHTISISWLLKHINCRFLTLLQIDFNQIHIERTLKCKRAVNKLCPLQGGLVSKMKCLAEMEKE